ncbi:hypothetical protein Vadar_028805 [Vaccinium darrowii]|uniref:Uncharacterized protein n=1 Tax=Vaccinium darrowii TaxID=229202 RepID=A0ACB7Y9D2_9ERIC|nr:hypothetical protein Vadar_028805 [Vaccinium darrowii]
MGLSGVIDVEALNELPGLRAISLMNNSFNGTLPSLNKLGNENLCGPPLNNPCPSAPVSTSTPSVKIVVIVVCVVALRAITAATIIIVRKRSGQTPQTLGAPPHGHKKAASNDLDRVEQGTASPAHSAAGSRNLLPVVAFYDRKEEKLWFLSNRSRGQPCPDWPTRLKIIKGVAKGLLYLYNELPSLIVPHGHLKSSNVLLNKSYEPLLTDYALVPVVKQEHAQDVLVGYKSPEYKLNNRVTKKTDVWSFGILILEILTGKFPANILQQGKGSDTDLVSWVESVLVSEDSREGVFDKDMGVVKNCEGEMMKLLKIGMCCAESDVEKRLDMKEAVERIQEVKEKDNDEEFYSSYTSEGDVKSARGRVLMWNQRGNANGNVNANGGDQTRDEAVLVAIDKDKSSQFALKWAIDNLLSKGQTVTLIHVKQRLASIPTPLGSQVAVSDVNDGVAKAFKAQVDNQAKELFLPFRAFCARKDIKCKEIILEDPDVSKVICDFVKANLIEALVVGASSRNGFVKRFKATDIPTNLSKGAPEFCSVYVISQGKIQSVRYATSVDAHPMQTNSARAPTTVVVNITYPLSEEQISIDVLGKTSVYVKEYESHMSTISLSKQPQAPNPEVADLQQKIDDQAKALTKYSRTLTIVQGLLQVLAAKAGIDLAEVQELIDRNNIVEGTSGEENDVANTSREEDDAAGTSE